MSPGWGNFLNQRSQAYSGCGIRAAPFYQYRPSVIATSSIATSSIGDPITSKWLNTSFKLPAVLVDNIHLL